MKDSLGDRMKGYEAPARYLLTRRSPVIVRVDGRAFHTLTRGMDKPFDHKFINRMIKSAILTSDSMQGFKAGYVQSDEASFLLTDYDDHETQPWFGYVKSKVETITSATMTAHFIQAGSGFGVFDARAFNIPRDEVANYFLWRSKDWHRNSVQMYCRSFFSDKEMHGQGKADQHEMLHSIGKNWTADLSEVERNGTWIFKEGVRYDIRPNFHEINEAISPLVNCDLSTL